LFYIKYQYRFFHLQRGPSPNVPL